MTIQPSGGVDVRLHSMLLGLNRNNNLSEASLSRFLSSSGLALAVSCMLGAGAAQAAEPISTAKMNIALSNF